MPVPTRDIIARLCRESARHQFPLGAVRVQKLVYLIECEFYRWERSRLTNEKWIYYHYGPWSPTLDDLLRTEFRITPELTAAGVQVNRIENNVSEFYRMPDRLPDVTLEGIVEQVVERWLTKPVGELLDFVYFYTPPMKDVVRGDTLDFATIASAKGERQPLNVYALAGKQKAKADRIKQGLAAWREAAVQPRAPVVPADNETTIVARELDERERSPALDGRIAIVRDDVERMPGEVG